MLINFIYRYLFIILSFSLILTPSASYATAPKSLEGEYMVRGWKPGNRSTDIPDYKGWVELTPWGEAWKYRGFMDRHSYHGVGLYDHETGTLSLSFTDEDNKESGVTVLKLIDGELKGSWVFIGLGKGKIGTEIWTKK